MSQTKAQLVGGVGFSTADSLTVHNGLAVTGVVTATSFAGDITGNITGNATGLTGSPSIVVTDITASGNITIGGTLTYDDVTNVDSIGIVTARTGVHFGLAGVGGSVSGAGNANFAGIVTATSFSGDGSNLSNTGSTLSEPSSGTERIVTTSLTTGTMTSSGTGAELAFDYANNHLEFSDSTKATFGTGNDLEIYHDGSDSFITQVGTGFVYLQNTTNDADVVIRSDDGSGDLASYVVCDGSTGKVKLYYYGAQKFETNTAGVVVTGEVECDSLDVNGVADITGNVTLHANLDLQDDDKILLGTGDDLEIYHDGSNSYIDDTGTGALRIQGSQVQIKGSNTNNLAIFKTSAEVELYYDNSLKLETKSDGIDVTGEVQCDSLDCDGQVNAQNNSASSGAVYARNANSSGPSLYAAKSDSTLAFKVNADGTSEFTGAVTFGSHLDLGDSDKILLGAGDDLQIYHDGSHSYIDDTGTGNLIIRGSSSVFIQKYTGETCAEFNADAAVKLNYDNSLKCETTSSGITVTGDVNSTSDINLKKDIEVVTSATEMLNQLRGVKFTWKENDEKSVGVIAQEVEAILPELVRGEEGNKSVNYSGLIAVLIEAVKELSARVAELENR